MTYTDTLFLVLFALVVVVSFALKPLPRAREWLLIGFSLFIIASWGIFDAALFISIAVANFFAAYAVTRLTGTARRILLVATIATDIATLALFKYSNFISSNNTAATGWPTPQLALGIPLAISFYTFHVISYLVDVHRKVVPEASFRQHYIFYLSFFPHVVARTNRARLAAHAPIAHTAVRPHRSRNWRAFPGDRNFLEVHLAASLQEFWRRWHITFYRWLRDYVYIGLGGSHVGFLRTGINVFATMVLGGLWHDAGWGFILWGAMHGALLVVERALGLERTRVFHGRWGPWWVVTQIFVVLAWVPFRAPDLAMVGEFYATMVVPASFYVRSQILEPLLYAVPVVAHQLSPLLIRYLDRRHLPYVLGAGTGVMLLLTIVVHSHSKVFIYFKF